MTSPDLPRSGPGRDADGAGPGVAERDPGASLLPGTDGPEGPGDPGDPGDGSGDGRRRPRKRRWPRVLIAILIFLVLLAAGLAALVWQRGASYDGNIDRLRGTMPQGERPQPGAVGTQNWLLVGSDTRATVSTTGDGAPVWKPGQQRSDTIMLLHLPADRKKAYIISFPRDAWVPVPGHGNHKINAAFSFGGPPLLIETVEKFTGIRIDHFGAIDFNGFKSMTDALGGVEVTIKQDTYDPMNKVSWKAGKQKLDGEQALNFVRQRYNLPGGDFDRIKRQQAFLGALARKASEGGTVTNPLKLDRFMSAFTKSISVDERMSAGDLRSLALSMRGVRASDVVFLTTPNRGSAQRGDQSVVLLHMQRATGLFEAVKTARVPEYVRVHGGQNSIGTVS